MISVYLLLDLPSPTRTLARITMIFRLWNLHCLH